MDVVAVVFYFFLLYPRLCSSSNTQPIILEKLPWDSVQMLIDQNIYVYAKHCYFISQASMVKLRGCRDSMASYIPRKVAPPAHHCFLMRPATSAVLSSCCAAIAFSDGPTQREDTVAGPSRAQ